MFVDELAQLPAVPRTPEAAPGRAEGLEIRKRLGQTRYQPPATESDDDTHTEPRVAPPQAVSVLYRLALDMAGRVRRAYLIGETGKAIATALELAGVDHELSGDLETAVRSAAKNARPGEIVLLAPACASYDQFHDFEERGEAFRRIVAEVVS